MNIFWQHFWTILPPLILALVLVSWGPWKVQPLCSTGQFVVPNLRPCHQGHLWPLLSLASVLFDPEVGPPKDWDAWLDSRHCRLSILRQTLVTQLQERNTRKHRRQMSPAVTWGRLWSPGFTSTQYRWVQTYFHPNTWSKILWHTIIFARWSFCRIFLIDCWHYNEQKTVWNNHLSTTVFKRELEGKHSSQSTFLKNILFES